jgi:hypothetical protein
MSGRKSRNKGARFERQIVNLLQDAGIAAERVPLSGAMGAPGGRFKDDVCLPILGVDRRLEAKIKATGSGFKMLYAWLDDCYGVVVRMNHQDPLIAIRLEDFARLAIAADKGRLGE